MQERTEADVVDAEQVLREGLLLPEDERTEVALKLLDSVDALDPHAHLTDEELRAEITRRVNDAVAGRTKGVPWEEVRRRLREGLAR